MAEQNQFDDTIGNLTVDRSTITKDDVLALLQAGLESGEPFATEFNNHVVKPLAKQIGDRIHVSSVEVDGKELGEYVSSTLKEGVKKPIENVTIDMGKSLSVLGGKFSSEVKSIASRKSLIQLPDFLSPTKRREQKYQKEVLKLQTSLLSKARKATKKGEVSLDRDLRVKDVLVPQGSSKWTQFQWNRLQRKLVKKADKAIDSTFEVSTTDKLDIKSLLPERGRPSRAIKRAWNRTQKSILKSIQRAADQSNLGEIPGVPTANAAQAKGGTGFKSILEEDPAVRISEFTDDALKQLKGAIPGAEAVVESREQKEEKQPPSWFKMLALAGAAILAGLIGFGLTGLFDDGPLKGVKKIALKTGAKLTGVFKRLVTKRFPMFLRNIGSNIIDSVKGLFTQFGKALKGVGKEAFEKIAGKAGPILKTFKTNAKNILKTIPDFLDSVAPKVLKSMRGIVSGIAETGGKLLPKIPGAKGILKSLGGKIAKFFPKTLLKKIPGIGTIISFGFAISRFKQGDIIGGLIDMASGIAVSVPGVGTALSIGLDVLNAWRDIKGNKSSDIEKNNVGLVKSTMTKVWDKIKEWALKAPFLGPLLKIGGAFAKFTGNAVIAGLEQLAQGLYRISPTVGGPLLSVVGWLKGGEEVDPGEYPTGPKFSLFGKLKDLFQEKILGLYKVAPAWMRWIMKRVPGMGGLLESEPDVELGIDIKEREDRIAEIQEKIEKKRQRMTASASGDNQYWGREMSGKYKDMDEIKALQAELKQLVGDTEAPMNDFIMRPGSKAQPFNSADNILSLKDDEQFNRLIALLQGNFESGKSTDEQTILRDKMDQENFRRDLKDLFKSIEELVKMQAQAQSVQSAQNGPATYGGLQPSDDGGIRDPAYLLRSNIWRIVRTGSSLL